MPFSPPLSADRLPLPSGSRHGPAGFAHGAALPFHAARYLIARPRHWWLVVTPVAINLALFVGMMIWGFHGFADRLSGWIQDGEGWIWQVASVLAKFAFWLVVLAFVYLLFTPMALLIACPFNDILAQKVERESGIGLAADGRPLLRTLTGDASYALASECRRLASCGVVFILLLPLNILPGIGQLLYAAASFYWACRCLALEFISFAADRRRLTWKGKWALLGENFAVTFGFGVVCFALFAVPLLNVLAVPVCAVGGTFLFSMIARSGDW